MQGKPYCLACNHLRQVARVVAMLTVILHAGCATSETAIEKPQELAYSSKGDETLIIGVPLDFRHVMSRDGKSCSMIHPGILASASQGFTLSDGKDSIGEKSSIGGSVSAQATSAQAVIATHALYSACELSLNYDLSKEEALDLFNDVVEQVLNPAAQVPPTPERKR